jgi:hypothetical protein
MSIEEDWRELASHCRKANRYRNPNNRPNCGTASGVATVCARGWLEDQPVRRTEP